MPSTANVSLIFSNGIDDSAVFYLNGVRVRDLRVPTNPALCSTFGGGAIGTNAQGQANTEALLWEVFSLGPVALAGIIRPGDNVLAVSVHQNATNSSDMVFICSLTREISFAPLIVDSSAMTNRAVESCRSTTFSVVADGSDPLTYQWLKDGRAIPDATNSSLTLNNVTTADNGGYSVTVSNPLGSITSVSATLLVTADTTPPNILSAVALLGGTNWLVTFDEPVYAPDATDLFAWIIEQVDGSGALAVSRAVMTNNNAAVLLTTDAPRLAGVNYKLTLFQPIADACTGAEGNRLPAGTMFNFAAEIVILAADEVTFWRYSQEGVDLGTTWREKTFNDSAWASGPAALAVEDTPPPDPPIRTMLALNNANYPLGAATPGNDNPTYYFRAHFNFPGAPNSTGSRLRIRNAFDDAGIVYINGVEIFRTASLTPGPVPFASYSGAAGQPAAVDNGAWSPYSDVSLSSVVQGDNVVAVELKQFNETSSDIYMALELRAEVPTIICEPLSVVAQPASSAIPEGERLVLHAGISGTLPSYQWYKDNNPVGTDSADYLIASATASDAGKYRVVVSNPCSSVISDEAMVVVYPVTNLLTFTHGWKYEQSGINLGTAWKEVSYDDSSWRSGPGTLGFETTSNTLIFLQSIAPPEGTNTVLALSNSTGRVTTYYFRTKLNVPFDATDVTFTMRAYVDDGAVWYVNGMEQGRYNMPNGPISYATLALQALTEPNPNPQTTFITRTLTGLADGENTIAVEVHQNSLTSSDICWGAEILAAVPEFRPPRPRLRIERGSIILTWGPAPGFVLQQAPALSGPWTSLPTATSPYLIAESPPPGTLRFFRLCKGCP